MPAQLYSSPGFDRIVTRASTLNDRLLAATPCTEASDRGKEEPLLLAWREVLAADGPTIERRFHWDELDFPTAARSLGATGAGSCVPPPSWLALLAEAYGDGGGGFGPAETGSATTDRALVDRRPVAFETLYLPIIRMARRRLQESSCSAYALVTGDAHALFERSLLRRVSQICGRALYAQFSVRRACQPGLPSFVPGTSHLYNDFVAARAAGGMWSFFQEYSVAARLCGVITELWIEAVREFLVRLEADLPDIEARFFGGAPAGQVTSVRLDLSDPHNGGKSVIIAEFEHGGRIVYKPRPLGLDRFFADVLHWLNGEDGALPMRPLVVLTRSGYGWIEFTEHTPCTSETDVERFYTRCGVLLCLGHVLNGTDFHLENLIASGEHPMLIDMEALLGHRFKLGNLSSRNQGAVMSTVDYSEQSVLRVGLLPLIKLHGRGYASDMGGIGGGVACDEPASMAYWKAVNTDQMQIAHRLIAPHSDSRNRVMLGERETNAALYADHIADGFRRTYELLLSRRATLLKPGGLLSRLKGQEVRFLFRDTNLYTSLLERALHPKYLRDGVSRAVQLDILAKPLLTFDERPAVWPIVRAETAALEQMDVPLFVAASDSTTLTLPGGAVIENCFDRSAYDEAVRRFEGLSEANADMQCRLIIGAFAANEARRCHSVASAGDISRAPSQPITAEEAIRRATGIATTLQSQALDLGRDGVAWFGVQYLAHYRRCRVEVSNCTLFDGTVGVALFLSALEHVSAGSGFRDLALSAITPLRHQLGELGSHLERRKEIDIGAGTGLASGMYALSRVARLLDAPDLLAPAYEIAALLTPDVFEKDRAFDILSGSAGAIVGLIALYDVTGDREVLARAKEAGRYLLRASVADESSGRRVWLTAAGGAETGLAHGMAGIAYALLRLYRALGGTDEEFRTAAQDAVAHEQTRLGEGLEGTSADNATAAWSCGATGIGLARLGGLGALDTPGIRREIDAALDITLGNVSAGCDTLCSGRMGRVDFLLTAGQRLGRPELVHSALAHARPLRPATPHGYETGWHPRYQDPGLFQGLAGIGYQLLRVTHPGQVPSVLLWE